MNKLILICFILLTTLTACQNKPMEEKFDYSGTLSAPYEYPVQVIEGHLISDDYSQSFSGWGIININWGGLGGLAAVGPDLKDVPHAFDMTWRSFQEDKWYTGKFDLPKDKILELFKEGYISYRNNKKYTYSSVIIGLAPQGHIVVWLGGGGAPKVEIETFKAKETQLKKEDYSSGNAYMFKEGYVEKTFNRKVTNNSEIKDRISKRGGLPPMDTYINTYRQKYNWKPVVELPKSNKISRISYNNYNGENHYILKNDLHSVDYVKAPFLISSFGVRWENSLGQKYYIGIKVEEEKELLEVVSQFSQDEPIDFIFKISKNNKLEKVGIRNTEKEVELHQFKVIAYKKE